MELNNYRSVTPIKKKPRKITASATLVLCLIALFVGVLFGQVIASGPSDAEVAETIEELNKEHEDEIKALQAAHAQQIKDIQETAQQTAQQNAQQNEVAGEDGSATQMDNSANDIDSEESGGFWSIFLIIVLVIVIGTCVFFAIKILRKKNSDADDDEYDDEEYDDEEYDDEEYDEEEYDDEEYDEEEYDDEEYDDEEYDDEEYDDEE